MQIAVDAMGGDYAPGAAVEGAFLSAVEDGTRILLVGREEEVTVELERLGDHGGLVEIVAAEEVVGMDEPAITPIRRKRRSSIRVCASLVKEGRAQALVTAGTTGAAVISAKMVMGAIDGVDRPALATIVPNYSGGRTVLLDVGANVKAKSAHLRQFAVMGHFLAQEALGMESPRVGLMSVGEEEIKGTDLTREVNKVLRETGLNFVGNVEGNDVFSGVVDVIVCDGFVGNVILKTAESTAEFIGNLLREEMGRTVSTRVGYLLARSAFRRLGQRIDYREYGAAPLLGVNGGCFIGHGSSNARAIKNAVRSAVEFCEARLHHKIRDKVSELHAQEERLLTGHQASEVPVP